MIFSYDIVMDNWSMTEASWNTQSYVLHNFGNTVYVYMGELPENLTFS